MLVLTRCAVRLAAALVLLTAPAAIARQACPTGRPALPAPASNPVHLRASGEVQWLTLPALGGHVYEVSFQAGYGARAEVTAFGRDCTRPLSIGLIASSSSFVFTLLSGEDQINIRVRTTGELIEPVVASFTITDRGPTADTLGNNQAWARVVATDGEWVDSAIDYPSDLDFFRLDTTPGDDYRIEFRGPINSGCLSTFAWADAETAVRLIRATSNTEVFNPPMCPGASATPTAYQVRAYRVAAPLPADPPGSCEHASAASVAADIAGVIGPSDADALAFPIAARRLYQLRSFGEVTVSIPAESCQTPIIAQRLPGARMVLATDRAGTLRILVNASDTGRVKPYQLRLDDIGPADDDWPNQLPDASAIPPDNATVTGQIEHPFDSDVFNLSVQPGWMYEIIVSGGVTVQSAAHQAGFAPWPLHGERSVSPDGLPQYTARLIMPLDAPEYRHLIVQHDRLSAPGPYSIAIRRLEFVGAVDQSDNHETPTPVSGIGLIDFHSKSHLDQDWVVYNGAPRRKYRVSTFNAHLNGGALSVGTDPLGAFELRPDGYPITVETNETGQLFINGHYWMETSTSLTAQVADIGPATDMEPDAADNNFSVRPNRDTIRARLDSGSDHDVFVFHGVPGHAYRIVLLNAPGVSSAFALVRPAAGGPHIRAFGLDEPAAGQSLWWIESPRFTLPSTGQHVIDVQAFGRPVTETEYQFRIESLCRADWNDDGAVTVLDLFDYLADFLGDSRSAEFDRAVGEPMGDFFAFIAAYFTACSE